ncbi:MAG: hypothetical protein H7263_06925, partial [Candidatus Sericytochromatia bacterium]|nr:hypothetical protein [Candidatus Sericytochromatia bacterium]
IFEAITFKIVPLITPKIKPPAMVNIKPENDNITPKIYIKIKRIGNHQFDDNCLRLSFEFFRVSRLA